MPLKTPLLMRMLLASAVIWLLPTIVHVQEKRPQPGTKWTDEQIKQAVAPMRAGRKLTPKSWPNNSKVAVCLSWDMIAITSDGFEILTTGLPYTAREIESTMAKR